MEEDCLMKPSVSIRVHPWFYSTTHNSPCKIIEEQTLWDQKVCRIWLPNQDAVVRVPSSALRPLNSELQPEIEANRIAYIAAAAKVARGAGGWYKRIRGPCAPGSHGIKRHPAPTPDSRFIPCNFRRQGPLSAGR